MYGGKCLILFLLLPPADSDDIVDHFGREIQIVVQGSGHFITRVKGSREGVIYLAMQYAKWMEILEPVSVRGRNEGNFQRRAEPLREKIKSF